MRSGVQANFRSIRATRVRSSSIAGTCTASPSCPATSIEHWFEVWDNDGVNGSKSARSTPQVFAAPTVKELAEKQDCESEAIKGELTGEHQGSPGPAARTGQAASRDAGEEGAELAGQAEAGERAAAPEASWKQRIETTSEQLRQSQQEQREFKPDNGRAPAGEAAAGAGALRERVERRDEGALPSRWRR
jgi:hypothetical protein